MRARVPIIYSSHGLREFSTCSVFLTPKSFANCKRMTDNLFNVECKTITFEAFVARNKLNI